MKNLRILIIFVVSLYSSSITANELNDNLSLLAISSTKAVLQWTSSETSCVFSYGTNPWDLEHKTVISSEQSKKQIVLVNLKSNSRYFCQVVFQDTKKNTKKIPPTPLQIKTLARDNDRSNIKIESTELIAQADTCVLIKISLSEPCNLDIKYGTERRSMKKNFKTENYEKIHYVLLEDITDLKNIYYFLSADNIFGHNLKFREPQNLQLSDKINSAEIPDEYKSIFIKDVEPSQKPAERGIRSTRQRPARSLRK